MEGRQLQGVRSRAILWLRSFFFSTLSEVIANYPNLFEGGEQGDEADVFGWLSIVDRLAGGRRAEWDAILEMKLVEFLNTLSFHRTISKERNKRLEQAANKGFESYVCACLNEML